jgi:hypothetical protein
MGLSFVFLQLAAAQAAAAAPDIEINAQITAREVHIRQEGPASLQLRVDPGVAPPVTVERSQPAGAKTYRNLTLKLHGEARLADPKTNASTQGNADGTRQP